ncbi:aminoglycoside phosphotransferase family protein [Labrenzia sp. DG1229]|uniref:aminoglycoside phosphotransferase family protein n=1 Tax=Labrenzia sp. DG1229 TaxID=681847 RepID=UPI0005663EB1|nr:aminoglycoside phosphotransferase family protein [Labrenzia sp. DG1229]
MMHANEIYSDETTARRLIDLQFPELGGMTVRRLSSSGTDNALYRVGGQYVMRLPRRPEAVPLLEKEVTWLPRFTGLPLEIPELFRKGRASVAFGHEFAVFRWLPGEEATADALESAEQAALDLAGFLEALRETDPSGAPVAGTCNHQRGVALGLLDKNTRKSIDILADEVDRTAAVSLWEDACRIPFDGSGNWLHGDLKPDNLLARNGRLCAVIDWGLCAVGDPAADYAATWSWVAPEARCAFRETLMISDQVWLRARGWALYGAVIALSYYRGGKNEPLCRQSRQTLRRLGLMQASV